MKKRQLRMASTIKDHLSTLLGNTLRWEKELSHTVRISHVRISSDLRLASIFVTFEQSSPDQHQVFLKRLQALAPVLERHLFPLISSKYPPLLRFFKDQQEEYHEKMRSLFQKISKDIIS